MSDRHVFLAALHDDGWTEFRAIAPGQVVRERFFRVADVANAGPEQSTFGGPLTGEAYDAPQPGSSTPRRSQGRQRDRGIA